MVSNKSGSHDARTRRVVAIEIGAGVVRAAEVEVRGQIARIVRGGTAVVADTVWEDLAGHREDLAHAIRAAVNSAGIRARSVVTALPRRFVTIKYARLPQGTPEQVAGMVRYEAQQYVPFPVDEVVLDHQVVFEGSDDMATVMIAAARKSLVNDLLAAFDRAGLDVTRISVTSLALAEHVRDFAMPTAICRIDGSQVDIAVASAGRVLFSRSADLVAAGSDAALGDTLAAEVARSLAAYQTEYRAHAIEHLVLVNDGSADGLSEALATALQVEVTVLNQDAAPAVMGNGAGALASGLALHESQTALSRLNLLPIERLQRKAEMRRKAVLRGALAAAACVIALGIWMGSQALQAKSLERRKALYENARLKRIQPLAKQAQDELNRVRRTYLTINYALGRDKPVVDVIKAISDALPREKGLHLTQLTFDRNGPVVLHGNAEAQESVTDFLLGLQTCGVFSEARLGYLGDAGTGTAIRAASTGGTEKATGLSFMLYCKLPPPPVLEDTKRTGVVRKTARTNQEELGQ